MNRLVVSAALMAAGLGLAGCRRDIAMLALREARAGTERGEP